MKKALGQIAHWWNDGTPWLENRSFQRILKPLMEAPPALSAYFNRKSAGQNAPDQENLKSKAGSFLGRNLLDIGFISSVSLFFAMSALGVMPLTVLAGVGLAGTIGIRAYQEIFAKKDEQTPEALRNKNRFMQFVNRPNASYSLSSYVAMAAVPVLLGFGIAGAIPGLGSAVLQTTQFISLVVFGSVFSVSNNLKAARLDKDRGYDVKPLPLIRNLNPSWSEKLSVIGNIARNFIAGPVIGLITLPLMREALKFSAMDKKNESQGHRSYTDQRIAPLYGWTPKSDSGMARTLTGVSQAFAGVAASLTGNFSEAVSLSYPAVANFILGEKSHAAYAAKLSRTFGSVAAANDNNASGAVANDIKPKDPDANGTLRHG